MTGIRGETGTNRKAVPDMIEVDKIRKALDKLTGLSMNQKLDFIFDGVEDYEHGHNIATLTMGFHPEQETEEYQGIEYPTKLNIDDMKTQISQYRKSNEGETVVLYANRGPTKKGEWRYFNMQNLEDFADVQKIDNAIIKGIKKWIKHITTILANNPEARTEEHKRKLARYRYELMKRNQWLRKLKKEMESKQTEDSEQNETDEK